MKIDNQNKVNPDELKTVMTGMVNSFNKKFEKESYEPFYNNLLSRNDSIKDLWKNPEKNNWQNIFPFKHSVHIKLSKIYNTEICDEIYNIYVHYDILKENVSKLVDCQRGCSYDKTRWILDQFLKSKLDNNYIPKEIESDYYYPDFGSTKQWMEYVQALIDFMKGNPVSFFEKYQALCDLKIIKMKEYEDQDAILSRLKPDIISHLNALVQKKLISQEEYNNCKNSVINHIYIEFRKQFLEKKTYTLSDEKILEIIKEIFED